MRSTIHSGLRDGLIWGHLRAMQSISCGFFQVFHRQFFERMIVCEQGELKKRGEAQYLCDDARQVEDRLYTKLQKTPMRIGVKLYGVPVTRKLRDGFKDLAGGREKNISVSVEVLFPA